MWIIPVSRPVILIFLHSSQSCRLVSACAVLFVRAAMATLEKTSAAKSTLAAREKICIVKIVFYCRGVADLWVMEKSRSSGCCWID